MSCQASRTFFRTRIYVFIVSLLQCTVVIFIERCVRHPGKKGGNGINV